MGHLSSRLPWNCHKFKQKQGGVAARGNSAASTNFRPRSSPAVCLPFEDSLRLPILFLPDPRVKLAGAGDHKWGTTANMKAVCCQRGVLTATKEREVREARSALLRMNLETSPPHGAAAPVVCWGPRPCSHHPSSWTRPWPPGGSRCVLRCKAARFMRP